jgi:hypothetical protein
MGPISFRVFGELKNAHVISAIRPMAIGADPELEVQRILPLL